MEIKKLTDVFSALYNRSAQSQGKSEISDASQSAAGASRASEAVKLSSSFESDSAARQARIKEIKSQVDAGTYKPDSTEVAKSVYRELFL